MTRENAAVIKIAALAKEDGEWQPRPHHHPASAPAPSPRLFRAQQSVLTWMLIVLLTGGSLWLLHQRQQRFEGAGAAGAGPFAAGRQMNVEPLGESPPATPLQLPLSAHKCTKVKVASHRVCRYSNLVLHGGTVYYLTDAEDVKLPEVDVTYHPAPDEKFAPTVLRRADAHFLLSGENENKWGRVPLAWLWKVTKRWDNLAHHLGEDAVSLHHTLCTYLGECTYPPRQEVQLVLLHSMERGAMLAAVNATLARCVTGWPAVYRDDPRLLQQTLLLESAWSGMGGQCHAQRGCSSDGEYGASRGDKRASMPPAALQAWRQRLGDCLGFDVATPAQLNPKSVLVIDRPYEAGRHMLNIRSVERAVRERFPRDQVSVQYFEDIAFPDQLRLMARTSLVIMVHGSAIALWPFLPPGAVAVHIGPDVETTVSLQRVWADHYARDWGFTGLSYVPMNNTDPLRQQMRLEKLATLPEYLALSDEEKLSLLEKGECPERLEQACSFHWKRQELNLAVDLDQLSWALNEAEAELLRKARQPVRLPTPPPGGGKPLIGEP